MIKVTNITAAALATPMGSLGAGEVYSIPSSDLSKWATDAQVLADITAGKLRIADHDGTTAPDIGTAINFLTDGLPRKFLPTVGPAGDYSLRPRGFMGNAAKGGVTNIDFEFDAQLALRGGVIESPQYTPGDWIKVQVVDKNNVTGMGGTPEAPTILVEYVPKWFIQAGQNKVDDVDLSEPILQGLFMRIEYNSVAAAGGTIPVTMNLISYELG